MPVLLCVSLERELGPCPKAVLLLDCSSLVFASPSFLDQQPSEPASRNSGQVLEAEEMGGTERLLCPRAPQGHAQLQNLTILQRPETGKTLHKSMHVKGYCGDPFYTPLVSLPCAPVTLNSYLFSRLSLPLCFLHMLSFLLGMPILHSLIWQMV